MSTVTQRQRAIATAVAQVHAMQLGWHSQSCGCVRHDEESTCGCPTCERVRADLCLCCGQAKP